MSIFFWEKLIRLGLAGYDPNPMDEN